MKRIIMAAAAAITIGCSADINPENVKIADYQDGKTCAVSLTFDDSMKEHYTVVAPELEKRGLRGTFWLVGAWMPEDDLKDKYHMTWAEAAELAERGHEMSNHAWSHPDLTKLTTEEIIEEIKKNDDAITKHIGIKPTTFCYPFNAMSEEVVALAEEGRVGTRLTEFWLGGQHSPKEYLEKQIADALASGSWIVGMTHGINYGYDCYENPAEFTDFLDYVKSMEDQIWIGTFRDVAVYKEVAENTELEVVKEGKGIKVTPKTSLCQDLFSGLVTMEILTDGAKVKAEQDGNELPVSVRDNKSYFNFNPFGGPVSIR